MMNFNSPTSFRISLRTRFADVKRCGKDTIASASNMPLFSEPLDSVNQFENAVNDWIGSPDMQSVNRNCLAVNLTPPDLPAARIPFQNGLLHAVKPVSPGHS